LTGRAVGAQERLEARAAEHQGARLSRPAISGTGKQVSSADWAESGGHASDARWRRIAPARNELHNGSNKSEREPTSGRSTDYGLGHLVQAFRGIARNFS
jgi:hypothetical protein